ncbi:DUF1559 domain-containing protein [Paludisphaera borealis]|uniref:DUF1559 domain-containing protein n=1 Tax=Paludisphaera borealis TaxID=1387353 RepID=A0A1U7CNZ6_9BACT|nr:DUF1559 domain-containing protein [Paludisphaera borealis]APW60626.1 hypothetical protein BSF38_02109 [Paludisphaera borealis]
MFRKFVSIGFLLAFGVFDARAADSRAEAIAPFLDADVVVVCRINIEKFDVDTFAGRLVEDQASAALLTKNFGPWLAALRKAGARDLYLLATLEDLPPAGSSPPSAVVPLPPGVDAAAVGKLLCGGGDVAAPYAWPTCATVGQAVFAGSNEAVERVGRLKPVARPELAEALAAAKGSAAEIVLMPSADARRVLEEMVPNLPAELGGGPVTSLTKGIRWGVLSLNDEPQPGLRLMVQAHDAAAAKTLAQLAKSLDQMLRQSPAVARFIPDIGKISDRFASEVNEDRITVSADAKAVGMWAGAMLKSARQGATSAQCKNNLKQIGLAMHNYVAAHGTFPPAFVADKEGKPLLSWRVLILPYLDENELYKEFHLDEAWDSPHNKTLIGRMPKVYSCPSELGKKLEAGKTTYATPRGPRTIFPGSSGVKLSAITDGTSLTILTIDLPADQAVTWTKPDDWEVPAKIDPKALLSRHLRGSNVGFADGSVRFLVETISPLILQAVFTMNGGEVVGNEAF